MRIKLFIDTTIFPYSQIYIGSAFALVLEITIIWVSNIFIFTFQNMIHIR